MSKEASVVLLGIFIAVLPFLGFPESWRVIMYVVSGLSIMVLGFMLRADHLHRESAPRRASIQRPRVTASAPESKKVSDIVSPHHMPETQAVE
jgi:hypothetical protein